MDSDPDNQAIEKDVTIIEARGIGPQAGAVTREALAVEREALAVEREAGGAIPPLAPPTLKDLLTAGQVLVAMSESMLAELPPAVPRRAAVEQILKEATAIVRQIRQEIAEEKGQVAGAGAPPAEASGKGRK